MRMPQWQNRNVQPMMDFSLQLSMDDDAGREVWIRLLHAREAIESHKASAIARG